jgi:hypothetical protein
VLVSLFFCHITVWLTGATPQAERTVEPVLGRWRFLPTDNNYWLMDLLLDDNRLKLM